MISYTGKTGYAQNNEGSLRNTATKLHSKQRTKSVANEVLTEDLLGELLVSSDIDAFMEERDLNSLSLSHYLQQLLNERGLERAEVVRAAGLNETFGYQIFKGQRKASRNKVLQIIFALQLSLREANRVLHCAGVSQLYCKNRRDAIIIFCLDKGCSLQETNDELYRFNEETIYPS